MKNTFQPLTNQDIVLVTGANGHVAQHVVSQLLAIDNGPKVRATVRSGASEELVASGFPEYIQSGRLNIVRVADITDPSAFTDALVGVTHIAHIASPLPSNDTTKTIQELLLDPAKKGTLSVLKAAAQQSNKTVKSVVVTGSFGGVLDPEKFRRPGYTYTSADVNPLTEEEVTKVPLDLEKYDDVMKPFIPYLASKTLAEKAAWDFIAANSENGTPIFNLTIIVPTYISGPHILPLKKIPDSFSFSNKIIWNGLSDTKPDPTDYPAWIDVRDVARAHIASLERPAIAHGKRYILLSDKLMRSELHILAKKVLNRELGKNDGVVKEEFYDIDPEPALKELELGSYIDIEKSFRDTLQQAITVAS